MTCDGHNSQRSAQGSGRAAMAEAEIAAGGSLMRASDVARILNVAKPTLYEWARNDPERYGAVRVGPRCVRFRRVVIDRLIGADQPEIRVGSTPSGSQGSSHNCGAR